MTRESRRARSVNVELTPEMRSLAREAAFQVAVIASGIRDIEAAGDSDVAEAAAPVLTAVLALESLATSSGLDKMAEVCRKLAAVLSRIAGNAALAKASVVWILSRSAEVLERMAADPSRSGDVDAARVLFQLELAAGPSRARH